jgi:integrase
MAGWIRTYQGKKKTTYYLVIPWDRMDGSGKKRNWQFKHDRQGDPFETMAQAERHLDYLRALIDDKVFNPLDWIDGKPHAFERLQEPYFKMCRQRVNRMEMSPSTIETKDRYWRRYFVPFFKGLDVKHITNLHLRRFHDQLPIMLKAKARLNIIADLEGFFRWCKDEGVIVGDPPRYTGTKDLRKAAKEQRPKPRASTHMMSDEDFAAALGKMLPEDRPIFQFIRATGCRQSEARALKRQDIDRKNRVIEIKRTFVDGPGGEVLMNRAKSDSNHPVYLTGFLEKVIKAVAPRLDHGFVFWNQKTGRPYTRREIDYRWRSALKRADLPHIQLKNATRAHTVCELLRLGYSYAEVGAFVGHKNESTTRHYGQVFMDSLKEMAQRRPKLTTKLQPKTKSR